MARIRVLDFESTGDSPDGDRHGLVEIAYTDLVARGTDLAGLPVDWEVVEGRSRLCNPGCAIPPETAAVHHILDEDVAAEPNWKPLLRNLMLESIAAKVTAYAGHGVDFEAKWIHPDWQGPTPLPLVCTYKAALRFWTESPLHSNMGLRYWRKPTGIDRAKALPAHRAGPDSYVTAHLLRDMLNDGCPLEQMIEWAKLPALTLRCKMAAYRNGGKGTPWEEVDDGLLHWILGKPDMDEDTVYTVRHHLALRAAAARDQRDREDLDRQLRENGLPEGAAEVTTPGESPPPPVTADPNQGLLL